MPKTTRILASAMLSQLMARKSHWIQISLSQQEALLAKMSRHHHSFRIRGV
ncbi:hypothetical protein S675_005740 [Salmonella enterica subsp. enterica]|nr:hypothetical protein [Salmonella enterica subsp. enterica]